MKAAPRALAAPSLSIGLIADTHGVLAPAIPRLFAGVNHIIHAGDVGKRAVLRKLEKVAPLTAISGNADTGRLAASLPAIARGEVDGLRFLVVHKPKAVRRHLPAAQRDGVRLIVSGHLHEPEFWWEDGILHVNPGSATAPDEGDPEPTVAIVSLLPEGLAVSFLPVPRVALPAVKTRTKNHHAKASSENPPAHKAAMDGAETHEGTAKGRPVGGARPESAADSTADGAPAPGSDNSGGLESGVEPRPASLPNDDPHVPPRPGA